MGMGKRLEAGWAQRLAWSVLVIVSLGLLVWVPFLYVAIRRGRGSDWGAFSAFALYELVTLLWTTIESDAGDLIFGAVVIFTLAMAVCLLLFALFDKRTPKYAAANAGLVPGPFPGPAPGNPYLR